MTPLRALQAAQFGLALAEVAAAMAATSFSEAERADFTAVAAAWLIIASAALGAAAPSAARRVRARASRARATEAD